MSWFTWQDNEDNSFAQHVLSQSYSGGECYSTFTSLYLRNEADLPSIEGIVERLPVDLDRRLGDGFED